MRRSLWLLMFLPLGAAFVYFWAPDREAAVREATEGFIRDVRFFENEVFWRPPLPGAVEEGAARGRYALARAVVERLGVADHVDWCRHPGRTEAVRIALDLVSPGTRTRSVGRCPDARSGRLDAADLAWVGWLREDLELIMADLTVKGSPALGRAVRRGLEFIRLCDDLSRGTTFARLTVLQQHRGRITWELARMVERDVLSDAELAALTEGLTPILADRPAPRLILQGHLLAVESTFYEVVEGGRSVEDQDWSDGRRRGPLGILGRGPSRKEVVQAWATWRDYSEAMLGTGSIAEIRYVERAFVKDRELWQQPILDRLIAQGNRSAAALRMADLTRESAEGLLLAALAVLQRRRTGAWPDSLQALRPPEVRAEPGGRGWVLAAGGGDEVPAVLLVGEDDRIEVCKLPAE